LNHISACSDERDKGEEDATAGSALPAPLIAKQEQRECQAMDASGGFTAQNLSPRQHDVFKLIVRGLSNKEIARALNLAEGTVKIHVAALLRKLGVHRRAAVAIAGGLLSLPATGVPPVVPENHVRRVA
jgi:DNA-binding NarL/FixJ family response regulator